MPPELGPALAIVAPIVLLLALGAWLAISVQRVASRLRARAWRKRHYPYDYNSAQYRSATEDTRALDAADQLRIVMSADFAARPLLNQSEARVFEELCQVVMRCKPGWRVMAQVSLGEVLRSRDAEAFSCVNSKRVDMLLIDEDCRPRHAIEYHGEGHYQGTAAARDAVKKEALRRAGIGYHEVVAGKTTPAELRTFIETLISQAETRRT
jgi:hypothetical protein